MQEKIVGYALLIIGVALIFYAAFDVYSVFNKKKEAVNLFDLPPVQMDLSSLLPSDSRTPTPSSGQNLPKAELVSKDTLNKPLNLFSEVVVMGFIVNIGFKLGSIGVQFLRPIKVTLKEKLIS